MEPDGTELEERRLVRKLSWLILGFVGIVAAISDLLLTKTFGCLFFIAGAWPGIAPWLFPRESRETKWLGNLKRRIEIQREAQGEPADVDAEIIHHMTTLYVLGFLVLSVQLLMRLF
ncbi:hypothetical protein [Hyphomonas sp.]|uniref:hypothetical protein n=1 Tax=Hyphomonas sp. TaxID=87 RepID=UPI000C58198B|nr:hypothetical protein [Hyphomonas sp.]MAB09693.1 hypothetical protein [Hyphomonas sp.]MAU65871.1 hypothetical protein [Hyphomonas sp.]MBM56907.1 hypothetical protein [Hyphomonas sp.]